MSKTPQRIQKYAPTIAGKKGDEVKEAAHDSTGVQQEHARVLACSNASPGARWCRKRGAGAEAGQGELTLEGAVHRRGEARYHDAAAGAVPRHAAARGAMIAAAAARVSGWRRREEGMKYVVVLVFLVFSPLFSFFLPFGFAVFPPNTL